MGNLEDHIYYNVSGYCEFETDNPNVTFDKGKLTLLASEKGNTITGTLSYAGGELSKDISIALLYHCTIEYAGDAVTEDAQTVFSGTEITLPDAPERTGYSFLGWRCSADDTDYQPGASYTAAGDVIFTAWWEQKDLYYSAEGAVITEHSRAGGEAYHEMAEIKAPDGDLVYDGAPKAATVTYSAGWQGGDLEITYSDDNYINAGEVTAGITIEGISASVQYTIKEEHSSVTTHPVGAHLTYTAGAQALVMAGNGTGGTMQYSLISGGPYSVDIPAATDEGSYTVFYKIVGDGNHYDTAEYSVTAVIGAAPVSFDVLNSRQLYDGRPKDAVVKQRAGQVPLDERDFLVVYRQDGYPADPRSEGEYEVWVILRNEKFQLEGEDYATREKQVGTLTIDAAAPAGYTAYYDPSDDSMKAENATVLSGVSASASWNSGWYAVRNGATIDGSVTVTGDVNLILDEGCMLMITKGITVNRGNSLTIWGGAYEGGMLVANGGDYQAGIGGSGEQDNGAIAINGGTIRVTGGLYASGIGGGSSGPGFFDGPLGEINTDSTITISGGEIYAKSGDTIPAIGAVPNFHQSFSHVTKSAGTSVEWTGNPNSEWSWTEVEIQPMILVEGVTILGNTELTYGGDSGTLTAVVTPADADIKTVTWDVLSGADTIELRDNQNGTATITPKKAGAAQVQATAVEDGVTGVCTVKVLPISIADAEVRVADGAYTYTGSGIEPEVEVTLAGNVLTAGTDYTVAYSDNVNAGTATVTVTGTGNYSGTASAYTVTLVPGGGTINSGKNVTAYTFGVGAALPAAEDMTYTGHTFGDWYADRGFTGEPVTEISQTDTGNKTYYAKWTANVYEITVSPMANGSVTAPADAATGETVMLTVAPEEDYALKTLNVAYDGGTMTPSGGGATYHFIMPAGNVMVTAEFEAKLADAENVELDKATLSLTVGETATLTANVTPSHAGTVSWRVHPLAHIVEINASGNTVTVAAKSAGTAVITAAIDGNTASCAVTVTGGSETPEVPGAPDVKIDFINETLGTGATMEYSLTGGADSIWTTCGANMAVAGFGWDGTAPVTVYFRYAAAGGEAVGAVRELEIPAQPGAPAEIRVTKARTSVTLTCANAQFSKDNDTSWQPGGRFDGLTEDAGYTIYVRTPARQ